MVITLDELRMVLAALTEYQQVWLYRRERSNRRLKNVDTYNSAGGRDRDDLLADIAVADAKLHAITVLMERIGSYIDD